MYTDLQQWAEIRRRVLVEKVSRRQILRETGMHCETLQKILGHREPPGYRRDVPFSKPKLGPFPDRIRQILEEDRGAPKKQRHTAKRIFERIQKEGYTGGSTQVTEAVRELKQTSQEVFVPFIHRPGEAQVDFGYALVNVDGQLRKLPFFVMTLPYSDAMFVQVFERISTEIYWEAHRRAFEFFGGVPWRITYDNDRTLAAEILGAQERKLTEGFLQLKSHYLFNSHFCQVRRANEKGVVESMVKYARLNFLVPVPQVRDLEELNSRLREQCVEDRKRRLRGQKATKEVLLQEDQIAFLSLPAAPFDACRKASTTVNSESLVRFDCNDYSVPVRYAHHPVVVKGYVDRVEVCYRPQVPESSTGKSGLPRTDDCGSGRTSHSSRCIIWHYWNRSRAPSTMPAPWRTGICRIASPFYVGVWKTNGPVRGHANSSACSGFWRSTRCPT